jgi:hypothetical protein
MESVLKHPLARGVLNCAWSGVSPRLRNCARTPSPLLPPVTSYVHRACCAEIRRAQEKIERSIGRGVAATKIGRSIFPASLPEATKDDSNDRRGDVR